MQVYPVIILDLLSKQGKPEAIHCYSERSFNFLSGVLKDCNINIMKDTMEDEYIDFATQLPHLLQVGKTEAEHTEKTLDDTCDKDHNCSCSDDGGSCGCDDCGC
jgi:hypothetical protein